MSRKRNPPVAPAALALAALALCSTGARAVTYDWLSGSFVPGTTAPSPLQAPDVLNITGVGGKSFSGVAFTNESLVTWQAGGGALSMGGGAAVANTGTWDLLGDNTLGYLGGGASFSNSGTLRKSGGAGVALFSGGLGFANSGTIDVQSGTLRLSTGSMSFSAGSQFTGAGVLEINANSGFSGSFNSGNLMLTGGAHTGSNAVLNGTVGWTGGTLAGTWTVAAGQTLDISGANKNISGGATVVTNDGTVRWQGSTIVVGGGASVVNNGLWDAQADDALSYPGGGASFTNNGTFRKSGGAGVTLINGSGLGFTNNGVIDVQGGTLRLSSGPIAVNGGSQFTGAGVVEVTSNSGFSGAFTSSNLMLTAGTHTGNAAVLNGRMDWTGGTLAGTWTVAAGQTLDIGGANKSISGSGTVITNDGTVRWQGSTIVVGGGASVVNNGLWDAQGDDALSYPGGGASFINNGRFLKSGGTGDTLVNGSGLGFTQNGVIEVQSGTVLLSSGPITVNAGSQFTGPGVVRIDSNSGFNGGFTSSNLMLTAGTHTGNAAVLNGRMDWTGGTLAGTWTVASGQTLDIGGANKSISGGATVVTNGGTVRWQGSTIVVGGGASVVNNGLWDAQGDDALSYPGGGASFTNNGMFVKTGGAGTTTISGSLNFSNPGQMDVQVGTIAITSAFTNTGTMMGDGRYAVSGVLTNQGTLAPGSFGVGALDLGGNLVQTAAGVLMLDLTDLASFDLLAVTGSAQVGGTLALNCLGLCSFDVGDSFTVLTSTGARTGAFGALTLNGFATGNFDIVYGANSVSLLVTEAVTAAVPEPGTWAMLAAGLLAVGAVSRRRARPARPAATGR